jgi:hypothetical protein
MTPTITVRQTSDVSAAIQQAFKKLNAGQVLVGIPEDKAARKAAEEDNQMSNAAIYYVQEYGSPKIHVPARASLIPGIQATLKEIIELLKDAGREALRGNASAVTVNFNKIGLLAVNSVRAKFVDNDWPALAPATLAARRRIGGKMPRKKKGKPAPAARRSNPLIVTGQLRKAITHVIREK